MAISVCVSRCQILFRINTNARSCGLTKLNNSGHFFLVSYNLNRTQHFNKTEKKIKSKFKRKTEAAKPTVQPPQQIEKETKTPTDESDELVFKKFSFHFHCQLQQFIFPFFTRYESEMYVRANDTSKAVCLTFMHRNWKLVCTSYIPESSGVQMCVRACVCVRVKSIVKFK